MLYQLSYASKNFPPNRGKLKRLAQRRAACNQPCQKHGQNRRWQFRRLRPHHLLHRSAAFHLFYLKCGELGSGRRRGQVVYDSGWML